MRTRLAQALSPIYREMWEHTPGHPTKGKAIFSPQWGSKWSPNNGIMIVGKATNGWGHNIDDTFDGDAFSSKATDITWVQDTFYRPEENHHWYGNKSAFFRVQKKISLTANPNSNDNDWEQWLVFTDLYKIVPAEDGNPTTRMIDAQRDLCIESLRREIEIFAPRAIVFLTSFWETSFIQRIISESFVHQLITIGDGNTACRYGIWEDRKIICTSHPQGKREDEIVANIARILTTV